MTPLVLLPGMMCNGRIFEFQINALRDVVDVDVAPIGAHDTITRLAEDVLASAPGRFAIAGLSMGGIVAMEVLRQAPDRVTRIALLDTNPLAEAPDVAARREPQINSVQSGNLTVRDARRDETELPDGWAAPGRDP